MRGVLPLGERARGPSRRAVALLLGGGFVVAASTTLLFLGMRAVMDVGGFCAEGGPYVIETPCPEGAPAAAILGVFGWFGGAALLFAGGAAVGGAWVVAGVLAWSALFGSLGWNFLEYAFGGEGIEWGWLVCGVVFEAMAIVPLLFVVPAALSARRTSRTGMPDPAGPVRPRGAAAGVRADAGVGSSADPRGAAAGVRADAGDDDLASSLERLAALHASGALTDDEFARAKGAVLGAEDGGRS